MSKLLFYKRMNKYLVINLNYFDINACNLFSIWYLCFIGSVQASKLYRVGCYGNYHLV